MKEKVDCARKEEENKRWRRMAEEENEKKKKRKAKINELKEQIKQERWKHRIMDTMTRANITEEKSLDQLMPEGRQANLVRNSNAIQRTIGIEARPSTYTETSSSAQLPVRN